MTLQKSERDYAISMVRILATACIFYCHVLQYLNHMMAWWLNVGVQIFLVMSGFLYGMKSSETDNDIAFYKKTFSKILLDYYLVIVPVLIYQMITIPGTIDGERAYKILFTYKTLDGGQHMWYIPYILVCYLITPFCIRLFRHNSERPLHLILSFLGLLLINHLFHDTFFKYFNAVWINCYITGLFLGYCKENKHKRIAVSAEFVIVLLAILMNILRICILYVWKIHFEEPYDELGSLFFDICHGLLGCSLFFCLRLIFIPLGQIVERHPKACRFFRTTDSLCYDIYIVHHFFIMDRYSLMDRTDSILFNVGNIVLDTLILAVLVYKISSYIRKKQKEKIPAAGVSN